jgi:hypothetical protein
MPGLYYNPTWANAELEVLNSVQEDSRSFAQQCRVNDQVQIEQHCGGLTDSQCRNDRTCKWLGSFSDYFVGSSDWMTRVSTVLELAAIGGTFLIARYFFSNAHRNIIRYGRPANTLLGLGVVTIFVGVVLLFSAINNAASAVSDYRLKTGCHAAPQAGQ